MATELYREIPCEVCGLKPWESVYAFRSPGIAHLLPSDDLTKLGDPCPGSGGSREEVTIDYEAVAGWVRWAVKSDEQAMKLAIFVINTALGIITENDVNGEWTDWLKTATRGRISNEVCDG